MKSNNNRILSVLLISLSLLYNSCTLVGLGIGAAVDSGRPDPENMVINQEDYKTIERSKKITVYLKDNSVIVGRFKEITEEYLILNIDVLRSTPISEKIKLDEIRSVEIKAGKNGKSIGLWIGLGIDIVLLLILLFVFTQPTT